MDQCKFVYNWEQITDSAAAKAVIADPNALEVSVAAPKSAASESLSFRLTATYNGKYPQTETVFGIEMIATSDKILYVSESGAGVTADARAKSLCPRNGIAVIGGFDGTETSKAARAKSAATDNIYANSTILSDAMAGDDGDRTVTAKCTSAANGTEQDCGAGDECLKSLSIAFGSNAENAYQVVCHEDNAGLNETAALDGIVIEGGNANGIAPNNVGGDIYRSF